MGNIAIANAILAYQIYGKLFTGPRWQALTERGARSQRLLRSGAGVKDPAYRDVRYIEELIGLDTVNTVPPATLEAFRDHGCVRPSLGEAVDEATAMLEASEGLGISLDEVTDQLLDAGMTLFVQAYNKLLRSLTH